MVITPTLHFHGQCQEALKLYERAFGLKVDFILHNSDADKRDYDCAHTEEELRCVYHSESHLGTQRFMMADDLEQERQEVTALFLTLTFETKEEVRRAFEILSEEGRVFYPLKSTTYSSCMGTVVDKFGFRWGLMTEQTER